MGGLARFIYVVCMKEAFKLMMIVAVAVVAFVGGHAEARVNVSVNIGNPLVYPCTPPVPCPPHHCHVPRRPGCVHHHRHHRPMPPRPAAPRHRHPAKVQWPRPGDRPLAPAPRR